MIAWLAKRWRSCAEAQTELEARVSLAERQAALCAEAFRLEWSDRQAWQQTAVSNGEHAERLAQESEKLRAECAGMTALGEDLLAIVDHLTRERDALARELWMERRRNEELRKPQVFDVSKPRDSIHRVIREGGPVS